MNKTLIHITAVIFLFLGSICRAQDTIPKNVIYGEFLGPGSLYSINYERMLTEFSKHYNLFGRIGFESHHLKDYTNSFNPQFNIPMGIHVTYSAPFRAELGIGVTLSSEKFEGYGGRDFGLSGYYSLGIRYQKESRGIFARLAYTPIIEYFRNYRHWGGLAIGYSF